MQRDAEKIEAALWHCDCNDRDAWITCGMAVKDELGEAGFDLWDAWSANSPKYKSRIAQVTWRSFRRSGVTAASLYKLAMEGGWRPAQSDSRPSAADIAAREERRRQEAAARDAMRRPRCCPENHNPRFPVLLCSCAFLKRSSSCPESPSISDIPNPRRHCASSKCVNPGVGLKPGSKPAQSSKNGLAATNKPKE